MNGLLDYQCEVHESGYKITTGTQKRILDGERKVEIIHYIKPIDSKSPKRVFNLTDYPGAYYELVYMVYDFKRTEEYSNMLDSLIKFTNKYGLLENSLYGESTERMMYGLLRMSRSVAFMEGIKSRNLELLKGFIIKEDGEFKVKEHNVISTYAHTPPRNYYEAAYHYISNAVNHNLKDSLVTEIIVNHTNTGTDMIVRPEDLISALWLQLAHAVSRNLEFKQCAACSTFFEVKSKKRKNEKIYCSDRCRVRVGARKRREKEKAK